MVDGWMKDFLISPCSVYIRTLVYIWQVFDIKMDLTYFVSANSATFGDYSVCRLWVLKIILKICLVVSPCLGVVQLQLSCPPSFYPNQVTKLKPINLKPILSTPLNLSKTTSINFYRKYVCTYSTLLYIHTFQKWTWIAKNGVVPIPLPRVQNKHTPTLLEEKPP